MESRGGQPRGRAAAAAGPAHSLLLPGLLLRGVEIGLLSALYVPTFGRRRCQVFLVQICVLLVGGVTGEYPPWRARPQKRRTYATVHLCAR